MTDLTFLPMLYMWTDASILRYVKILSYAKDLIPDICGQHLTRKPVGFMQSCCFVFNGNETKTCLLCNSYLFGMNNVLYIE